MDDPTWLAWRKAGITASDLITCLPVVGGA